MYQPLGVTSLPHPHCKQCIHNPMDTAGSSGIEVSNIYIYSANLTKIEVHLLL